MSSVMPLSMIARRKPCVPIWVPSTGPMPPFLQVAEWPDGTKIWRAMDELSMNLLAQYVTQEAYTIPWEALGYDKGHLAMFAITVTFESHDIPVGYVVVSNYEDLGVPALHELRVRDPMRPIGVYLDDSIKGVTGIEPRQLGHQVAWFLLEALRVDPDTRSNPQSLGNWIRLGIPSPIADRFFDERTYRWGAKYQEALKAWRERGRFAEVVKPTERDTESYKTLTEMARRLVNDMMFIGEEFAERNGPFRATSAEGERGNFLKFKLTMADGERFELTLFLSPFKPGVWKVTWALATVRGGTLYVPLKSSEVSLMDALQQSGIVVPESRYEDWLDVHLVPGHVDFCPKTLEAYDLLGVSTPLLLPPEALWAMVRENP